MVALNVPRVAVPQDVLSERVALGQALQRRAHEVAEAVLASWLKRYTPCSVPFEEQAAVVLFTCSLGTELIGRYLETGEGATAEEGYRLAERSTTVVVEQFAMTDVLKNYLIWRDETMRVLLEEATRLGSGRPLVSEATAVVRFSADVSMVKMVREFDIQRRDLQRRLDDERAKLTHLALHDPLTGLANRTLLLDRLAHAIAGTARRPHQVGVLFLDLDGFKAVNDTYGHPAGDRLLIAVADRLTSLVRPSDTVARLGGDEFVVVCDDLLAAEDGLRAFAERVRSGVSEAYPGGEHPALTVSVGGAIAEPGADPEAVLACADAAMYAAKHQRLPEAGARADAQPAVRPVLLLADRDPSPDA